MWKSGFNTNISCLSTQVMTTLGIYDKTFKSPEAAEI